jgi:hypothetical protein
MHQPQAKMSDAGKLQKSSKMRVTVTQLEHEWLDLKASVEKTLQVYPQKLQRMAHNSFRSLRHSSQAIQYGHGVGPWIQSSLPITSKTRSSSTPLRCGRSEVSQPNTALLHYSASLERPQFTLHCTTHHRYRWKDLDEAS